MRKVITQFLNDVVREEVAQRIGADHYERTDKRSAYRNGIRKVSFDIAVIPRYARVEKALEAAVVESYLQGVSTRRVQDVVTQLGVENVSASTVSRISKELDEVVDEFLKRPIELPVSYLFVDASYFKIRSVGQYLNKALFVATGVREDGYREILGTKIAEVEDEGFWSIFFKELKDRGGRNGPKCISTRE